eukprot:CAMPEP_0203942194 /NCGR_PEP_ID=MMETSP0359-20131031/78436_1 /ASSEMBLY_ACC=CAM_ASM_000338 /TAXON_ID=268821 /ORGANISM="Scrippsiella Hangoei, Strain SHTV-5" /LENGTH=260 /DNA_ID=CAMNT_0050872873 /DNA_START=149 /DNA_END=931 /DNA_ORIENTATION=+
MFIASLLLCQAIHNFMEEDYISHDTKVWMYLHYGTPTRSFWTVFELTMSGGWPTWSRRLIEEVSGWFALFFFIYVSSVVFAMTRIISALFLKDTLAVAANDTEMMIQQKASEKQAYAEKLLQVFYAADISGDGLISEKEFMDLLTHPDITHYLAFLELDATESKQLFYLLAETDNTISVEEFVKGAMRLKGTARSQDVVMIMHDVTSLKKSILSLGLDLRASIAALHAEVSAATPDPTQLGAPWRLSIRGASAARSQTKS